jgi:hypothetical protein
MAGIPTFVFFNDFDPTVMTSYNGPVDCEPTELLEALQKATDEIKTVLEPDFTEHEELPVFNTTYIVVRDHVFRVELLLLPSEHRTPRAYLITRSQ